MNLPLGGQSHWYPCYAVLRWSTKCRLTQGINSGHRKDSLHDGGRRGSCPAAFLPQDMDTTICQCVSRGGQKGPVCLWWWLCKGKCVFFSFVTGRGFWPGHLHPGRLSALWRALPGKIKTNKKKQLERLWLVSAQSLGRSRGHQQQCSGSDSGRWSENPLEEPGNSCLSVAQNQAHESGREISERPENCRECCWCWPFVWLIFLCNTLLHHLRGETPGSYLSVVIINPFLTLLRKNGPSSTLQLCFV